MKPYSLPLLLTLATLCSLFFPTGAARATPAPGPAGPSYAECLEECFGRYVEGLRACKSACWQCDVWILFCVAGHHDQVCLNECRRSAREVYQACRDGCVSA